MCLVAHAVVRARFDREGPLALYGKALGQEYEIAVGISGVPERSDFELVGPYAIVDIRDPLVHHRHWRWDSFEAIAERVNKAFASACEAVLMRISSPGGDVDGCFDTARALRKMAEESGKPLFAYGDGMIASAAYALASAANRIYVSETTNTGSIGIIEGLVDQTEADARMGVRYAIVSSGARKSDGNPHVAISKEAVANLQGQVDSLAEMFFALVEDLRGFPADKARALEARMLLGRAAVTEGLADEVVTWSALAHGPVPKTAQRGSGENSMAAKAMNLRQHMAWAAEHGDDEEKELAKRMMGAIEEGDGDGDEPPEKKKDEKKEGKKAAAEGEGEGKKAAAEGEGEGEGKKAAAEGEGEGKHAKKAKRAEGEGEGEGEEEEKEEKKGEGKKAAALAARVQALEAESFAREQAVKRQALMATRSDLAPEVIAWLDSEPLSVVERALKTLPKGKARAGALAPAAASQVTGTLGRGHTGDPAAASEVGSDEADYIARKMGAQPKSKGIVFEGRSLELGHMTHEEARAFLKKADADLSVAGGGK